MATKSIVDTHALVWFLEDNPSLGAAAKAIMEDPTSDLVLPAIALAEACWIVEHGKSLIPTVTDLLAAIDADPRITVMPLTRGIVEQTSSITAISEMHDRQIVATALILIAAGDTVALLTKDANIVNSGLVPVAW